jgi:hypothetical protein
MYVRRRGVWGTERCVWKGIGFWVGELVVCVWGSSRVFVGGGGCGAEG